MPGSSNALPGRRTVGSAIAAAGAAALLAGCTPEGVIPPIDESGLMDEAMEAEAIFSARRQFAGEDEYIDTPSEEPPAPAGRGDLAGVPDVLRTPEGEPVDPEEFRRQQQASGWILKGGAIRRRDPAVDETPLMPEELEGVPAEEFGPP